MSTRPYRSTLREDSARRTRRLITDAARRLFLERGYAETSMVAVARAAGVSGQTVYNVFGGKAGLLKHVYDVTLVGDAHTAGDKSAWGAPPVDQVIAHTNLYWRFQAAPGRTAGVVGTEDVVFTS